ncbi:MAG TPA: ABC transporter permease, partial [Gammaproteobacteria bacterium]|nr:ABC transporter permease [Gammaproteobacteria bacterium]
MRNLPRQLHYAVRTFLRAPGFAITVVLTLGLGVGANIAVFSAIDSVLLRPLPFPDGDRLVRVSQTVEGSGETSIAPVRLEDWRSQASTFDALSGYYVEDVTETSGEFPQNLRRASVAPHFLEVLGVAPLLGRDFAPTEYAGVPSVVVVSERYWRERLGGSPAALSQQVRIGAQSFSIVGVAAPHFPAEDVELWMPAAVNNSFGRSRQSAWYTGIGRLKSGVTLADARADLAVVQSRLAAEYANTDRRIGAQIASLKDTVVGGARRSLWLVFGAVSVLLLITCTNVATLFLTRAARRQYEIAIRRSYGASISSVIGQTLVDTGVLAVIGTAFGLALAAGALQLFRSLAAGIIPRAAEMSLGARTPMYTAAAIAVVTLLCGLLPAVRSARADFGGKLAGARGQVSTSHTLHWLLVGVQVALCVVLLSGAGLLLRSFQELSRTNPGFDPQSVLTFRVSGTFADAGDWQRLQERIGRTIAELSRLPGVEGAATSATLPGVPTQYEAEYSLSERRTDLEASLFAEQRPVSPSYFATLGIAVLEGEVCQLAGGQDAPVMVNRVFVDRYFKGVPAVGRELYGVSEGSRAGRIVGIVSDARERGLDREPSPTVYWCTNANGPSPYYLVRTRAEPAAVTGALRERLKELEPLRAVYEVAPLDQRIGDSFAENRLRAVLLASFAVSALVLACIGVYGTLSYIVSLRRREVGLRLALGAVPRNIVSELMWRMLRVVCAGCVAGLVLTAAFGKALSGMLYGVSPSDPNTFVSAVLAVLIVASVACFVPAIRAARLDPMAVLR